MTDYTKLTDSEIDRLVAERVMGWHIWTHPHVKWEHWRDEEGHFPIGDRDYHPTTDLNQAFEALDKFGHSWHLDCDKSSNSYMVNILGVGKYVNVVTDTPARAICIALLEAKEI